jgi:predicted Ser/Thr protein kinase
MLKADERFLYVLLTLAQEKNIKTGRFPLIYADECVIAHTNETEFNEFLADKKSEALHDRMIMVRIPYNLQVSQEERIYAKLLRQTNLQGLHIAPHTLRVAAIFAVLSRLEPPKMSGLTLIRKLKLYDGEDVEGFPPERRQTHLPRAIPLQVWPAATRRGPGTWAARRCLTRSARRRHWCRGRYARGPARRAHL